MKVQRQFPFGVAVLTLAMLLGACNQTEKMTSSNPGGNSSAQSHSDALAEMNREITLLKAKDMDPEQRDQALRQLLTRYGYSVPASENNGPLPAPLPEIEPGALEKSAASNGWRIARWKTAKSFNFSHQLTYSRTFSINNNETFAMWTETVAPADPMLVAYYHTTSENPSAFKTQIVAYNDDFESGNRNAKIQWTNATGSAKTVTIMALAYSEATVGTTRLKFQFPLSTIQDLGIQPIRGVPQFVNTQFGPYPNCTGPTRSRITLTRVSGGGFQSAVLALNSVTQRGGTIHESVANSQTLVLDEVLPSGPWSFVAGVMLDINEPVYEESIFNVTQQDMYSCTQ